MQALDLYASIEEYLDFEDEIHELYKAIGHTVLSKDPKTLIDIGCGQGEFCHIMQFNGIDTLGVDLSQKQIEIAKSKDINAKCIDIKDIKEKYDCATAIFDVINYIPKEELKSFLKASYNLIKDKGHFIFDINSLFGFEEIATGTLTIDNDDKFISLDAIYDQEILSTKITVFNKLDDLYKKESGTILQYFHTVQVLEMILKEVGFTILDSIEFNLHSESNPDKFIIICQK